MSAPAEDHWSKLASDKWGQLPGYLRDQVETLVREVCRYPSGDLGRQVPGRARMWIAEVSEVAVFYQVSTDGEFVLVVDVVWRG